RSYRATASPGGASCRTDGALSCTIDGLTNGDGYTVTVTATNEVGGGASSAPTQPVTPSSVPSGPAPPTAEPNDRSATTTWAAPDAGGSTITGYRVESSGGQSCEWTRGPLSCVVYGLTNGTSYTFTVVATNGAGSSSTSKPSAPATPVAPPRPPSAVVAIP